MLCTLLVHMHPCTDVHICLDIDRTFYRKCRAESCDSVASDSSVLEMQPDMPKIGQLEFALEYDRYSIKTIAFDADNDLKIAKRVPVCVNHSF